jgi:hydrogenase nickel incorporation protein HypB
MTTAEENRKEIPVAEKILGANEQLAQQNRAGLDQAGILGFNFMASPGAGKTSVIEKTIAELAQQDIHLAVVDGDIATSIDADRAEAAGAIAYQINTGGECHLDAVMLRGALEAMPLDGVDLLIVENVGNLICPASFPLGTHFNVLVASVPEGDDKPYKYPSMYRDVDALIINKIDLLPYIDFDMEYFRRGVEVLNPGLVTFPVSCTTGEGLEAWFEWLLARWEAFRSVS